MFKLTILLAFLAAAPLSAQTGATATILGTVTDPTGAVVSGVTVTAVNTETGLTRSGVTGGTGGYTIFSLPIGRYDVRAQAPGFRLSEVKDIPLSIDQRARVDFPMVVGETRETVVVTG